MSYPQKGATRHHKPKFLDRMMAAENEKPAPFKQEAEPGPTPAPEPPPEEPEED
jgi:hypothetical protein